MKRRLAELCVLIAVLATAAQYWSRERAGTEDSVGPRATPVMHTPAALPSPVVGDKSEKKTNISDGDRFKPTRQAVEQNLRLRVDGVGIGMTYAEVLQVRGRPQALGWERGLTFFEYSEQSESVDRDVWFSNGRVVYCSGTVLTDGSRRVWTADQPLESLAKTYGEFTELDVDASWLESAGLVVRSYFFKYFAAQEPRYVGLRDLCYPLEWYAFNDQGNEQVERHWSHFEPWIDDYHESWRVGSIEMGSPYKSDVGSKAGCEVIEDAGYVRGFRNVVEARFSSLLGYHNLSQDFKLGGLARNTHSLFGVLWAVDQNSPRNAHITKYNGVVTDITIYCEDEALFRALHQYRR